MEILPRAPRPPAAFVIPADTANRWGALRFRSPRKTARSLPPPRLRDRNLMLQLNMTPGSASRLVPHLVL